MTTKRKYKTYTELVAAFNSGELDRTKYVLIFDNDCTHLQYRGDDMDEDEAFDHCETLFSGNGYYDIEGMADALGLPWEWC